MPKLSIGMPVHNGERFLAEALESLRAQTFADFEVVLCDNASTDGTVAIAERFAARDPRVRVHQNRENIGAAANFNRAFELCTGEYFKWAAHDDLCAPGYLEACVAVLDSDPSVVLCHSAIDFIDNDGKFLRNHEPELGDTTSDRASVRFRNLLRVHHMCFDIFGVIRREVLEKTPRIAPYVGSDRSLLAELGLRGRFHRVPERLFHSRDHEDRSIRSMNLRFRGGWFSPALSGRMILPFWRYAGEYLRSALRVPLPARERLAAIGVLPGWSWLHRRDLWIDLKMAIKHVLLRPFGHAWRA